MPNNDKALNLTKRQISQINKGNRKISGNLNALMDNLSAMTYGVQRSDKIDALTNDFNELLKNENSAIGKAADGDTTSFLTKLFSENNKRLSAELRNIEDAFNMEDGQLESFFTEQYKNRLILQGDLHEVASQLIELQEAIIITRDAIIAADVINGHMSRTITIDNNDEETNNYIPIIETMEKKFKLQEKIKNYIIPKSLEYGEYYVYTIPYSKLFEDFMREKNGKNIYRYAGNTFEKVDELVEGISLKKFCESTNDDKYKHDKVVSSITESVSSSQYYKDAREYKTTSYQKDLRNEIDAYLENIIINNNPIPLPIIEEGVHSLGEYYTEFVEKVVTEKKNDITNDNDISFSKVMKGIDTGMHDLETNSKPKKDKSEEDFSNIKDCYIKLMDPMKLLPIEIMDEVIGYYYIQEEDITPLAGILTSTMYYGKYDNEQNNIINSIAETIVNAFDKKFLEKNIKFKSLIVEALNYYKLNNKRIKFQFIPKEYIHAFKINEDESGRGVSIIEPSLFYAKLYLMLLLFKMMSIIENSNDTKVNYIRQSGIEKNITNKIQEIARKKQSRQVNLADLFSYTTLINKIGQGKEMYVPVGKNNERGIETEILQGQDIQINSEFFEMLKKAYITGTGVPDVLMNYFNEADFAKTLELANNRFQGRVVSFQLDYNVQITELYRDIARWSTTIPENIINTLEFNFLQPKSQNMNITNDMLNNFNALSDIVVNLYYDSNRIQDPDIAPKVKKFKQLFAKKKLPMLDFNEIDEIFREAEIDGTEEALNPDNENNEENA